MGSASEDTLSTRCFVFVFDRKLQLVRCGPAWREHRRMGTVDAAMAGWRSPRTATGSEATLADETRRGDRTCARNPADRRRWAAVIASLAAVLSGATATTHVLGDITMNRISTANGIEAVVFPHWKHRSRFRCYACHPDIFEMRAGANAIDMAALSAGEFCGRCHDGRTAWAISFETCRDCHSLEQM